METELWAIGLVLLGTLVGSMGPIYLKKASSSFSVHPIKLLTNWNLLKGISLYAIATIIFIPALKGGELSVLYPLVAVTYIWVSLLSVWQLGEKMNALKWIGVLLIILGVSFIGMAS